VRFTNLTKVFWPGEGYTKGDLIRYYDAISALLLPYLEDRPLVLTRYPDGIAGKILLPEGRAGTSPVMGAYRADLLEGRGPRDRLLHRQRCRHAFVRDQPSARSRCTCGARGLGSLDRPDG
jgi:hypothetical protein